MSHTFLEPYVEIVSRKKTCELVEPIIVIRSSTRSREDEDEHAVRPLNALSVLDRQRYFNSQGKVGKYSVYKY
ncbi:hypothetical protein G6F63_016123 [Rhizopus arrhizus]|nr:hypothetical protein G6F31_021823 [Rhizopus arrhizus]KAG1315352.1 hypothetical protein G6F63_016123 [Rhizopus arrhizus]